MVKLQGGLGRRQEVLPEAETQHGTLASALVRRVQGWA